MSLAVWMYGTKIGVLARRRGALSFTYTPEALDLGAGRPLVSTSMPVRSRPYGGSVPQAFFDGLLPEGEARRMIAYDFGLDERDVFGLLTALGRDCAGALVIIPEEETLVDEGAPEPISDAEVAERIRKLRVAPLGVDQRVRASLAGMQEKLLLARVGEGWGLPVDGAPSTHIIKPRHPLLENLVANEAFCLRVATHLGVTAASVEVGVFEDVEVLVVERYDRAVEGERVMRLHQEDFCQAHGLDTERKYEERQGLSLRQCAELLVRWSPGPEELDRLLDIVTLNALVGNADAHAKNLSLLHTPAGEVRLAPAYDVMSTVYYPAVSTTAGMFVNGIEDIRPLRPSDLIREAVSWGLAEEAATARVEERLAKAEEAIERAAGETRAPDELVEAVAARARAFASASV